MPMEEERIILFDGLCNLCNNSVQFVIKRDKQKKFKFASLQSEFARKILEQFHLPNDKFNSFILLENGRIYTKSTGALRMLSQLKGWKWAGALRIVPAFIRDGVYNLVSKYRYKWFGKREECMIPSKELSDRFI